MKEILGKAVEFFRPRSAMGFLFSGWLGACLVNMVVAMSSASWILSLLVTLGIWVPLWYLAKGAREKQVEIAEFLDNLAKQVAEAEKEAELGEFDDVESDADTED